MKDTGIKIAPESGARKRKWLRWAAVFVLAAAAMVVWHELQIHHRLRFGVLKWWNEREWKSRSLWLPDYRNVLKKEVEGIDANLSGLTWNNDTKTLFAAINRPPAIAELSPGGDLLRLIPLRGFHDTEAVEYIGDNRYIVAEERKQRLSLVTIDADTRELRANGGQRITLGLGETGNFGVEGLAWDAGNKKLYAAKERFPMHIYEVSGFPHAPNTTMDIEVAMNRDRDDGLFVTDISGLDFDHHFQHLLILSDASKLIIEVDKNGRPISSLSLLMGNNLGWPIPQAEGIALDDKDNLYLVSEPNLFYMFQKNPGGSGQ